LLTDIMLVSVHRSIDVCSSALVYHFLQVFASPLMLVHMQQVKGAQAVEQKMYEALSRRLTTASDFID
jgi:hypothetical protein